MSSLSNLSLSDGDVIENLFHFLWAKDELDEGLKLNIPDTVIYKFHQPAFWYFTSNDGTVKRKMRINLQNTLIEEAFLKKNKTCDIIAYYIYTKVEEDGTKNTVIEYLNEKAFHEFLYYREKTQNGILQRFVEPKEESSTMIRVAWSPKVCVLERRKNIRPMNDTRYDPYERAVTFDGEEYNSEEDPVRGSILPGQVQFICERISQHVDSVSFQKHSITRMLAHLKVDTDDNVWFLWVSSIRTAQRPGSQNKEMSSKSAPLQLDSQVRVPGSISLTNSVSRVNPAVLAKDWTCPCCGSDTQSDRKHSVAYKTIMFHFAQLQSLVAEYRRLGIPESKSLLMSSQIKGDKKVDLGMTPEFGNLTFLNKHERIMLSKFTSVGIGKGETVSYGWLMQQDIPPLLSQMHPKLTVEDYHRFRRDPLFLYKTLNVCVECYLVFANSASLELRPTTCKVDLQRTLTPGQRPGTTSLFSSYGLNPGESVDGSDSNITVGARDRLTRTAKNFATRSRFDRSLSRAASAPLKTMQRPPSQLGFSLAPSPSNSQLDQSSMREESVISMLGATGAPAFPASIISSPSFGNINSPQASLFGVGDLASMSHMGALSSSKQVLASLKPPDKLPSSDNLPLSSDPLLNSAFKSLRSLQQSQNLFKSHTMKTMSLESFSPLATRPPRSPYGNVPPGVKPTKAHHMTKSQKKIVPPLKPKFPPSPLGMDRLRNPGSPSKTDLNSTNKSLNKNKVTKRRRNPRKMRKEDIEFKKETEEYTKFLEDQLERAKTRNLVPLV